MHQGCCVGSTTAIKYQLINQHRNSSTLQHNCHPLGNRGVGKQMRRMGCFVVTSKNGLSRDLCAQIVASSPRLQVSCHFIGPIPACRIEVHNRPSQQWNISNSKFLGFERQHGDRHPTNNPTNIITKETVTMTAEHGIDENN